ncbi:MAG: hypothetical protein CME21_19915 [Gemmatimonadetes bacterium]|jgi:hypothetical protein|nr:hypothetical protein [Gemmatimonadota bacterium]HCK12048.1 hypothetical protein [Candidatus Latescibacterota bacterium]
MQSEKTARVWLTFSAPPEEVTLPLFRLSKFGRPNLSWRDDFLRILLPSEIRPSHVGVFGGFHGANGLNEQLLNPP